MKKQTKQKIAAGIAITGLTLGTIFGTTSCDPNCDLPHNPNCDKPHCPGDCVQPEVKQQSTTIYIAPDKTMDINYEGIDNAMPIWWNDLLAALVSRAAGLSVGHYILEVQYNGSAGFVAVGPGTKKATVSEEWLSNASYADMRSGILLISAEWIAMNKSNIYLAKQFDSSKEVVRTAFIATSNGRSV
jgi:hypothetical protein